MASAAPISNPPVSLHDLSLSVGVQELEDALALSAKQDREFILKYKHIRTTALFSPTPAPAPPPAHLLYVAPTTVVDQRGPSLFLAGSIEQGAAVEWQDECIRRLHSVPCTIFNPRRAHWDPDLPQTDKNADFAAQVKWELGCQERADVIAMFFDPWTKSPVSLLELGLFVNAVARDGKKKLLVCCPPNYWRHGNVEMVCKRYGVPIAETLDALLDLVQRRFTEIQKW